MKITITILSFLFSTLSILSAQKNVNLKNIDFLLFEGRHQEAIDSLLVIEKTDSLNSNLYLKLGKAYQGLFKHNIAKTALQKCVLLDSTNFSGFQALANSYSNLGENTFAVSNYKMALELDSTNVSAMINLCKIYKETNNFIEAFKLYDKLVIQDPENSFFYKNLGYCCSKIGLDSLAILNYKEAIRLNENDLSNYANISILHIKNEDIDSALFYISKGLNRNKQNTSLNRLMADIKLDKKEYFEAVHYYGNAIAFGDSTYQNYQKLGLSYYFIAEKAIFNTEEERNKKYKTCIDTFLKSYKLNPQDQLTCMYLGVAYKETNKYEKALEYFDLSLNNIFPKYLGDIYYQMADTYFKSEKLSQAVKMSKKSVEHSPEKIIYLYTLATISDQYYKDKKIALNYYERFLKNSKGLDERLIKYSEDRILSLKEKLHFQGRL